MRESFQTVDQSLDTVANVLNTREKHLLRPEMALETTKTKKSAFVRILEQPASKGLRFRYECEGRSAGSIPGVNSSQDNKTFPTIQVVGYTGKAVVVVSCVTSDQPHRPHPHNLVGKEGCKKGVCTIHMNDDMTAAFPNLGIQCVKKKDIDESLSLRQQIRVDPFQTGFTHKTSPQNIDLNCVRLAFQVFLEGNEKGAFTFALKPVVSDPIYDRKAKCDLTICRLTETSGPVAGGKEILLFCDKISKDDIQVRFFEEKNDQVLWEGFGDFQPSDVHKQYGICFRTPRYKNIEIEQPVQVQIQLRRPSDGAVSESRTFEFIPLDAGRAYWSAKRLKTNYNVFNQILSRDQEIRKQGEPGGQELKHKVPLSRAPVMAGVFSSPESSMETNGESVSQHTMTRQTLKPVAMPGAGTVPPQVPASSAPHVNYHENDNISTSQLHPSMQQRPAVTAAVQAPAVRPAVFEPNRPTSELSVISDMSSLTQTDNISIATRQSVNEILSLADVSVFSGDTINFDNISVNTLLTNPLGMQPPGSYGMDQQNIKTEPEVKIEPLSSSQTNLSNMTGATTLGSMISVNTVKENNVTNSYISESSNFKDSTPTPSTSAQINNNTPMDVTDITNEVANEAMDTLDLDQIYDDVMQCVYDDVDIKYDDVTLLMDQPPVPPQRRNKELETNIDADIPDIDKPLPAAPRNNILTKLTEKKNEMIIAREKEIEKKRKEREEIEEQKRKEKEEKERKKREEKEAKKREEEEKKAKLDEQKMKSSLFQRLFQRSQSRTAESTEDVSDVSEEAVAQETSGDTCPPTCPPVPPHQSYMSQVSMDARLSELEQLINAGNTNGSGPGELERLDDTIVSEFTRQYPPDTGSGAPTRAANADINTSQPVQS